MALGFIRNSRWGAPQSDMAFMRVWIHLVLPESYKGDYRGFTEDQRGRTGGDEEGEFKDQLRLIKIQSTKKIDFHRFIMFVI